MTILCFYVSPVVLVVKMIFFFCLLLAFLSSLDVSCSCLSFVLSLYLLLLKKLITPIVAGSSILFKISTVKFFCNNSQHKKLPIYGTCMQQNAQAQQQNIQSNVILSIKQSQHLARNCKACQENYGSKNVMYMVGGTVCGMSGFCLNEDWIAAESLVCIQYK